MTFPPSSTEVYISVDVETAGPNPSQYSLLAIGACCVWLPEERFYIELKPVNTAFQAEALASCQLNLDDLARDGSEPERAMLRFEDWLQAAAPAPQRPLFVGFNAPFDWMFINDYFHRFLGHNPFGHTAIDIKSFYMGQEHVSWSETTMQFLGKRYLDRPALVHHALRDALDQAEIFRKMLAQKTPQP